MGMEVGPVLAREAEGLKCEVYFCVLGGQLVVVMCRSMKHWLDCCLCSMKLG